MADLIPTKVDPFIEAIARVEASQASGKTRGIHYGADRVKKGTKSTHNGIDLGVAIDTPIQPPADCVLIGIVKENPSIGNGLVFFVPGDTPYFVQFAHLSPKTFNAQKNLKYKIGSELIREAGVSKVIAYSGESGNAKDHAHLHVTVGTVLAEGKEYAAALFQRHYENQTISNFLRGKNLFTIIPPARIKDSTSLEGYLDPLTLIKGGKLKITSIPDPIVISKTEEKPKAILR